MKNLFTGMTKPLIAAALLLAGNAGAVGNYFIISSNDGTESGFDIMRFATDGSGDWSVSPNTVYLAEFDVSKVDSVTLAYTAAVKMTALDIRDTALRADSTIRVSASVTPSSSTEWLSWSVGDTTVLKLFYAGSSTIGVRGLKAGKTKLYVKSSLTGLRDSATVTVGAPPATAVKFGVDTIYTWPGKVFDVPMAFAPFGDSLTFLNTLQWKAQGRSIKWPDWFSIYQTDGAHWFTLLDTVAAWDWHNPWPVDTLLAICENGEADSVVVASTLAAWGSWDSSFDNPTDALTTNTQSYILWRATVSKYYIRSYYAADDTSFDRFSTITAPEHYNFAKVPTSEYTVATDDASITIAKADDDVTYELTRTEFKTVKNVTLTFTFGKQIYTRKVTLMD